MGEDKYPIVIPNSIRLGLHEIRQVLQLRRPRGGGRTAWLRREGTLRGQRGVYRRYARSIVDFLPAWIVRDELPPAEAERRRLRGLVRGRTTRSHGRGLQDSLYGLQRCMSEFTLTHPPQHFIERGFDSAIGILRSFGRSN